MRKKNTTVSPPAVCRLELILKCFDIGNTKESRALAPDQGFQEAAGETQGCGENVPPSLQVFSSLPGLFFSSERTSGGDFMTATTGCYFHGRGQLLESPLAPSRAASFRSWRANMGLTEPNQVLIKRLVLTATAKL